MSVVKLFAFKPRRLIAAREKVVEAHPIAGVREASASPDVLEGLKRRVMAVAGDPAKIASLAHKLSPRERGHLVSLLGSWPEFRQTTAEVLKARVTSTLRVGLWRLWQRFPDVVEVCDVAAHAGRAQGWAPVVADEMTELAQSWVESPTPGEALRSFIESQGVRVTELPRVAGCALMPGTPLLDRVWVALLTNGTRSQLILEGVSAVSDRASLLNAESHRAFGANYLNRLNIGEWNTIILESIHHGYGTPRAEGSQARFWAEVHPSRVEAFRLWCLERALDQFFGSGTDRHQFWKAWIPQMRDARKGTAGSTPFGILDFGSFVAVEFFETGNAAYFYWPDEFARLPKQPSNPSDLKSKTFRGVRWWRQDNRLIHREGWQPRGASMVRAYLK